MIFRESQKPKDNMLYFQARACHWFHSEEVISNNLRESIKKMDILTILLTDHSPIFFSLSENIATLCAINLISLLN